MVWTISKQDVWNPVLQMVWTSALLFYSLICYTYYYRISEENHVMKKKSIIFIIVFWSIILIPIIVIGLNNYKKENKLNQKIENSKNSRIIELNKISTAITLDELYKIETSKKYTKEDNNLKYENDSDKEDFSITYTNVSFYGSVCEKEFFFVDELLHMIIIDIPTDHYTIKDIYEEVVNINGEPDIEKLRNEKLGSNNYTWYGINGCLTLTEDNISKNIQVIFTLE